jgi:DNA-binding NtrC family response regulator
VIEADAVRGLEQLESRSWDMVLVDAEFAGGAALELVERLATAGVAVVVLAAQASLSLTVRALRVGARDVVAMPPSADRLRELVDAQGSATVPAALEDRGETHMQWIGTSAVMLEAFRAALRLAESDQPVLLWGETGTGKELIARVMHEQGPRAASPFITVNCGFLPESVLAAELFGQDESALPRMFSPRLGRIQRAAAGTLYLDEAAQITPRLQSKLMEVVRAGAVPTNGSHADPGHARLIAAMDRDPKRLVEEGMLRKDLYYALSGGIVQLPPLRERGPDDIAALAMHFLRVYADRYGRRVREIGEDAWRVLLRNPWTGNVRQLRTTMERAVLESHDDVIRASHLPAELTRAVQRAESELSLKLEDLEKQHIQRVLTLSKGHLGETAELLGIHRNTLRRKLQQYDIAVE